MSFFKDVTVGEGQSVSPNTKFIKIVRCWISEDSWPSCYCLKFYFGDQKIHVDKVMFGRLDPGLMTIIGANTVSLTLTGQ